VPSYLPFLLIALVAFAGLPVAHVTSSSQDADASNGTTTVTNYTSTYIPLTVTPSNLTGFIEDSDIPVHLNLTFSPPLLGETSDLEVAVSSAFDADNFTIGVLLPSGLIAASGDLTWKGELGANSTHMLLVTVRALSAGNWTIRAKAGYFVVGGWFGDIAEVTVAIGSYTSYVVQSKQPTPSRMAVATTPGILPQAVFYNFSSAVIPSLPSQSARSTSSGNLLVKGKFVNYISEDNIPSAGTQRNDQLQPMVWGQIQIYDGLGNYLGGELTGPDADDAEGNFQISINNPGLLGFYVVVSPWSSVADAVQSDGSTQFYAHTSTFTTSATTFDIGIFAPPDTSSYRAAWRAYETIVNDHYGRGAWNFVVNKAGFSPSSLGSVTVVLESNVCPGNGDACTSTDHIYIRNDYSTMGLDTLQHEYGHYVMYRTYGNTFPPTDCPSPHYVQKISGSACGWTEGWADFFTLMVQSEARRSLGESPDHVYEWGNGSQLDLEAPTWGTSAWDNGPTVEGRTAGALNDIYDWTNDPVDSHGSFDSFTDYYANIWDTFVHSYDYKFQDFWNDWKNRGRDQSNNGAVAALYHNTIDFVPHFTNSSAITLSPSSGPPGTVVTVAGSWFASGDTTCLISSSPSGLFSSSTCTVSVGAVSGSFTVATVASGSYMVTVTGSTGDTASVVFTVTDVPPSISSLSPDKSSPQVVGMTIVWTCSASDPNGDPISYRFWLQAGSGAWIITQDWSSSTTWSWSPSAAGTYNVGCWVRDGRHADSTGFDDRKIINGYVIKPNGPPTVSALTPDKASGTQVVGSTILWTASASDPEGDSILYRFWLQASTGAWVVMQDWSSSSTWSWTPNAAGMYNVGVWVRDGKHAGPTGYDDRKIINGYSILSAPTVRLSPTSGPTGTVVVVSGSSFAPADTTCLISSSPNGLISSSACGMSAGVVAGSFTVASGAMGGAYMVTVNGNQADSAATTFTVTPRITLVPSSGSTGVVVAISGSGFAGADTACVVSSSPSGLFSSSTCTILAGVVSGSFTVALGAGGSYAVKVSGSTGDEGGASFMATNTPPTVTGLVPDKPSPQVVGTAITWTCSATDPEGDPILYRFWLQTGSGAWVVTQDWSSSATWSWTPAATGTYNVGCWVGDGRHAGPTSYDARLIVNGYVIAPNGPPSVTAFSPDKASPQVVSTTITWTCSASDPEGDPILY